MKNAFRLFLLACLLGVTACEPTSKKTELTLWPASDAINLVAFTHNEEKSLTENSVRVGNGSGISLAHDNNTLVINWKNSGWGGVYFNSKEPADLQPLREGFLQMIMQVNSVEGAGVEIGLLGSDGMERRLPVEQQLENLVESGTVEVALPLGCLLRETDSASNIITPLRLVLGGSGQLTLERAAIVVSPESSAVLLTCPDRTTIAITPAMLDTHWAKSWWLPRHQQKLQEAAESDPEIVFLGDSITQGWERRGAEVFAEYFGQWRTLNLGFGGDRTENVLWRIEQGALDGIKPKLVVMMIGTNNTGHRQDEPEHIAEGIEKIVQQLQTRLPDTNVLMLAIFPRGATHDDVLRRNNDAVNKKIRQFADERSVYYRDINHIFVNDKGEIIEPLMPDLLHPNEAGYQLLAGELEPLVRNLLE